MNTNSNIQKKGTSNQKQIFIDLGLLSKKEVAKMYGVETCTIDRWVKKGFLSTKKIGSSKQSKVYFYKAEVLKLADKI